MCGRAASGLHERRDTIASAQGHNCSSVAGRLLLMPGGVDADGDGVFDGDGEERGRIDFEVGEGGGYGSGDVVGGSGDDLVEGDVGIVGGAAGELDVEVAVEVGGVDVGLGEAEADGDDGELGTAGDLKHVEVAVGVSGVKGFDLDGEEEVALEGLADTFASGGVADSVDFMERVGHVIGEGGLVEDPGLIGLRDGGQGEEQKKEEARSFHRGQRWRWMGQKTAMMEAP